ncbi:helix-turn-helix domain-containing protein [Arcanobacterium buesumense]|uniref:Helix-turn-helix domain-containing protein n=1 Tax=Arcanobacterium buesumense TaxID=2722751 RepID=A0A6H2EN68_9ACTO|nr:helix-turn-helix domain-containing protein [Arcanobacterium buesumense]QJC22520.1 helix-turn-helix domain-containing protein [Arcanobacterium buesumense]
MSELISASEAAALLPDTTEQSLLRWARQGKIPSVRLPNGRRFFEREDIEAILEPTMSEEVDEG